jgi:DNA-binding transcriptional MerR regulator
MSTNRPSSMRSAQVAHAAGVNHQTLRYYERRGLLAEPARSPGGHRLYPPDAVTVLRVIKAAQRLGFSLDEVADLLQTGRHRLVTSMLVSRLMQRPKSLRSMRALLIFSSSAPAWSPPWKPAATI